MRVVLALVCLLASCMPGPHAGAPGRPHVYLVVVDGLDARAATRERLPRLFDLLARERARSSFFPAARAVMPARTNPNHVTLLTGVTADAHGITGNAYWSRVPGAPPEKLQAAALIEVETLFTVAASTTPRLTTLGAFGKPKLARLFAEVPGRQRAPDVVWSPEVLPAAGRDPATGYSSDAETIDAALGLMAEREPDLAVLNLSDVDRTGHARGPDTADYARAVAGADEAIARLVDDLRARGRWERSIVIVTADHGMAAVGPTAERPRPVLSLEDVLRQAGIGGVSVVGDGGVEHVYAEGLAPDARELGEEAPLLARVAALARTTPGIAEILARLPLARVPTLDSAHPGWHLDHQRVGDLLLVAARGWHFVDPFDPVDARLLGDHGGPEERSVPLIVTGGHAALRAVPAGTTSPGLVDVGATLVRLLDLRRPRFVDGRPVPGERAGRPLDLLTARTD